MRRSRLRCGLTRYSVFRSSCIVSCGSEVVGAFGGRKDVDEAPDGGPKALDGAFGGFAQERFESGHRLGSAHRSRSLQANTGWHFERFGSEGASPAAYAISPRSEQL